MSTPTPAPDPAPVSDAEMAEMIDWMRYRHQPSEQYPDECDECGGDWPCFWITIIDSRQAALDALTAAQQENAALREAVGAYEAIVAALPDASPLATPTAQEDSNG